MADEPAPQAPPAEPQQPATAGPWQADIQAAFTDPQVQATVDAFLRSKIQPRMTQLEQQISAAQNAQQLWDAFNSDPVGTYVGIAKELYGDEAASSIYATLTGESPAPAPTVPVPQAQAAATPPPPTDPRYEEMYSAWQAEQELKAYDAEIARIASDPANADIDTNLIHTFVAAADGDFNEAITRYRSFATEFQQKYGVTPTEAQAQPAPPVMGADAGGAGAAPPIQQTYRGTDGLHAAIDEAVAEVRRNAEAPPVV